MFSDHRCIRRGVNPKFRTLYGRQSKKRPSWECVASGCVFIDLLVLVCNNFHRIRSARKGHQPTLETHGG
jgi:hypothetical protein